MRLRDLTSNEAPVALTTLAVTAAGLLFNVGFFARIGVRFIPLFSLSEHLVFSLTFALFALVLGFATLGLYFLVMRPLIGRARQKAARSDAVTLRDYAPAISVLLAVLVVIALVLLFNAVRGLDAAEVGFLLLLGLTFMVFLMLIRAVAERHSNHLVVAAVGALLVSFAYGYFYASTSFWRNGSAGDTVAVLADGNEYRLARGGERYALLVEGNRIFAQPSAAIARIDRRF